MCYDANMCDYKVVIEGGEGEIVEKKSRFICTVKPVKTEKEAQAFVDEIKKKYWDAKHNCSAMVIGSNNEFARCSDDGEPSGTAGRPMLEVLIGEGVHDVACVVTRYFGGVLLGTGGLVRAYQASIKEGLAHSKIAVLVKGKKLKVTVDYTEYNRILNYLTSNNIKIENSEFTDIICLELSIRLSEAEKVKEDITEMTGGKAVMDDLGECDILL